jgi:hypothetical protein
MGHTAQGQGARGEGAGSGARSVNMHLNRSGARGSIYLGFKYPTCAMIGGSMGLCLAG